MTYLLYLTCICWFLAVRAECGRHMQGPIVRTTYGDVEGARKTLDDDSTYEEFLGMPFAAPPIGELRFQKPGPVASWNGTRPALDYGPRCVQIIAPGQEDCLYLSVVVPDGVDQHVGEPLPVMVYSYGGAFVIGSANQYPGQGLAIKAKVIVVTYNYRLGPMGFLSTGDNWSPGNYGLWDARAVFIWVRDNIRAFGGDPGRVTAIGQSAGGVISTHFVTSPMTQGLMHRVIAMSGSSSAFFGAAVNNRKVARNLGIAMLCPIWSNKSLLKCLRGKEAADIDVNGYVASVVLGLHFPSWVPVLDGDFVPRKPQDVWADGAGANIDFMIGSTHDDGAGLIYVNPFGIPNANMNIAADRLLLNNVIKALVRPLGDASKLLTAIQGRYLDLLSEEVLLRTKAAAQAFTDFAFGSSAHQEAGFHAANTKSTGHHTYLYTFRYRQSFMGYEPWVNGSHVDDVWSLIGGDFFSDMRNRIMGNFSADDLLVSSHLAHYYGNFAYTGNPNEGPHQVPTEWPQYNSVDQRYMEQNQFMEVKTISEDLLSRYRFWTETWPNITDSIEALQDDEEIGDIRSALATITGHVTEYVQRLLNATI